jgi:Zn-dependent M16 (insulinase) family peptidase
MFIGAVAIRTAFVICRFFFYGDDPVERRLKKLAEYLNQFEASPEVDSLVRTQALFSEPRKHVGYYAAGEQQVC